MSKTAHTPADIRRAALDAAAFGDLQDEARIANELQASHGLTRTEALRAAAQIVRERRGGDC